MRERNREGQNGCVSEREKYRERLGEWVSERERERVIEKEEIVIEKKRLSMCAWEWERERNI